MKFMFTIFIHAFCNLSMKSLFFLIIKRALYVAIENNKDKGKSFFFLSEIDK